MKRLHCLIIAVTAIYIANIDAMPHDTIRSIRAQAPQVQEAYSDVSLACPNLELPSITGPKSAFRYIEAGCENSLTIRPNFGVSGGQVTGYNVYSIPYAPPFPFDAGTKIFINQDDVWGNIIQLPFKFCFFENTYNQAVVGANGLISFNKYVANQSSGWSLTGKKNIPDKNFKGTNGSDWSNAIYGAFEDIDPRKITSQKTNGGIRYGVLGSYPCRTLTVSWNKVPNFDCQSGSKYWDSFQIVLYEGTNVIDVYVNHKSRCASWNLGRGIIGIQNKDCTKAIAAPNRNTTDSWTADKEAWRFVPISTPQYTITYYDGMGINGRVLGQGEQITIDPTTTEAITARLQFTAANGDYFDLRDTAVIVRPKIERVVTNKIICEDGAYYWRGNTYTSSGTYQEGVGDYNGCYDKIYELNLSVAPNIGQKDVHMQCLGDTYTWKGKDYSTAGTYYSRYKDADGCEMIDTLVLKIGHPYYNILKDTICSGETYTWRGNTYTQSGVYDHAYTTNEGCDSIYQLHLVVGEKYEIPSEGKICEGNTYRWRGKIYEKAGVYYDSLLTKAGCDSIYRLNLTNAKHYKNEEKVTICSGETYSWHGHTYTDAGIYYDNQTTVDGCDSIHILNLHIARTYLFIEENTIRNGGQFRWRGKTLTTPGQYYDSLITRDGCDSVYQLNLKYIQSQLYTHTAYICEGETYTWRRNQYTQTGIYSDSLKNIHDGDSVYQLHLIVGIPQFIEEKVAICEGETYTWRGNTYTTSGTYYDQDMRTSTDCGTTYKLELAVGKPFEKTTDAYLCDGEIYPWRGFEYTKPGIYYDEYKTAEGCDSTYQLNLKSCRKYNYSEAHAICRGEYYQWRGKQYSEPGIYWDSLTTIYGCDSVYRLDLTVESQFFKEENDAICEGEKYDWRGRVLSEAGTYYDSLLTNGGCDSVYVLHLSVIRRYQAEEYASICEGQTYTWRGKDYSQPDTYRDYYTTHDGCDSVFVLHLTSNPTFLHREKAYICGGDAYKWHGKVLTEAGVYRDTFPSVSGGCDSICELTLGLADNYYFEEEYSACDGSYYSWHHQEISQSGIYWDSLRTVYGCDSVYRLNVIFHPVFHFVTKDTICAGETYAWRDSVYAIDSIYYNQLATIEECDSLFELRLTVLPTYNLSETRYFCRGETVSWHNRELTKEGIYVDSLVSSIGCDSIMQLELIELPTYSIHFYDTINQGQEYEWQGTVYRESGDYQTYLSTTDGCDSILMLSLTVLPRYYFTERDTICEGENYLWQGEQYTESDIYVKAYQTIHGNDSIYELHLIVMPAYNLSESRYICQGEIYKWHGYELSSPGEYVDSLFTINGCDSVCMLSLHDAPTYSFEIFDTICTGESYSLGENTYSEGGAYTIQYTTIHGCDSTYYLSLYQRLFPNITEPIKDVCADDEYLYITYDPILDFQVDYQLLFGEKANAKGFINQSGSLQNGVIAIPLSKAQNKYIEPDIYQGELILTSDYCKEQHRYDFTFNVLYPASVVVQKFNDVLAVQNENYNGGYVFSGYQWYADGQPIYGADMPYYYAEDNLTSTYYQVLLTRQSDGVSMLTCPIEPKKEMALNTPGEDIYVYHTVLDKNNPVVNIYYQGEYRAQVYDARGNVVLSQDVISGERNNPLVLTANEGIYLLVLSRKSGDVKVFKIIIR